MANLLINTTVGGNAVITTSNIGTYALTSLPSHTHDDRYYTETESDARYLILGGSWGADLTSNGWTRKVGYAADGGEWVLLSASGQISSLLDGSYFAGESGGFYSLTNSNTYASRKGFYNDGTYANFNTSVKASSYVVSTGAFMEGYGTYSSKLGRVAMISLDWNSNYDEPFNHGITSTDSVGNFADSLSINSFNDITLRLDANNNNAESYVRIMNNTSGTNTIAYIGYDGGTNVAWFGGVVTAANDFRAPIFYDSANTGYYGDFASTSVMNSIRFGTSTNSGTLTGNSDWGMRLTTNVGFIQFGPANSSYAHIYTDRDYFYFNRDLLINNSLVITAATIGSQTVANASNATSAGYSDYVAAQTNPVGNFNVGLSRPKGASYTTMASIVTGAIKIKLPPGTPVHGMWKMTVKIYEYGQRGNGYTIELGCHLYPSTAHNRYQWMLTTDTGAVLPIRYGTDGTSGCVWIGENGTTWSYPQIHVTEFSNGFNNPGGVNWNTGTWGVTIGTIDNSVAVDGPFTTSLIVAASAASATTAGSSVNFMSTSHAGSYWLTNNWTGTHWQITSNHGAGVRVAYADTAGSATTAGALSSMNISQFTNNSGYITVNDTTTGIFTTFLGNATSNIGSGYTRVIRNENGTGGNPNYAPILHVAASDTMWQIAGAHAGQTTLVWRSGYSGAWNTPWWTIYHSGNFTDNSSNWNTAYGWGNHASAGYLTSITSGNVTTALGFTPYNATNPSGYISSITSGNVTTALGYTPYNATNPNGYITGISFASVSSKPTTISGYGITDAITTANIGSQSVSYATTAGSAPNGGNVNQFYDVTAGVGNGLRFWGAADYYKISMGVGGLYQYGPVIDYSIKTQMDAGSTGRGFTWGNNGVTPVAALNATSGDMQIAGSLRAAGHLFTSYNGSNILLKSADNTGDAGILLQNSGGSFKFQIYGNGTDYGFLNGNWASWDIRKTVSGPMYMNNDNTYYLQTNSTSNFVALNIQGSAVVHAGNIGSQSVSYAATSGSTTGNAATVTNGVYTTSSQNNLSGVLNFGSSGATPYSNPTGTSNGISFGGIESSSLRAYGIFTEQENVGGNYSKLTINYHTGIRLGAAYNYGGTRFYNNYVGGGSEIFSVGNGDNHVRVLNNLYVTGTVTGSNLSGTNTGDQTNISGNAATATNVAWTGVTSRPTALSQFTNDLGNYGGWITGINSGNVTTALGFTPYNATNPAGYITSYVNTTYTAGSGLSLTGTVFANTITNNNQLTNGAGYITSYVNTTYTAGSGLSLTGTVFANTSPNIVQTTVSGSSGSCTGNSATATNVAYSGLTGTVPTWNQNTTGNAATVGGYAVSGSVGANTVVIRDGNNYIYAYYINSSVSETENPTINSFYTSNGDGWLRKSSVAHVKSQLGLGSLAYLSSLDRLSTYGTITSENWNTYFVSGQLIASSVSGNSGSNRPSNHYDYGAALSYGVSGGATWQMYFPENSGNSAGSYRNMAYRTGWNGAWGDWRSPVNQIGQVVTIAGSNGTGIEVHSGVGYNQDPLTYFLLRGQADSSWKALKIRLTGDAGGQDIEFRRIAENSTDARMFYVPRGANQVIFDYTVVTPSDSRLKDNLTLITTPVDKIKSLRGVEFDWNSGEHVGTHDVGLIAQDVEAVLPEAVTTQEDGYKNLAYTKVIPLLVEAMKEQQTMIEALRAEIELLKNR